VLRKLIASLAAGHVPALNKFWSISVAVLIRCNLLICMDNPTVFCVLDHEWHCRTRGMGRLKYSLQLEFLPG